jgi:hypothetical protein
LECGRPKRHRPAHRCRYLSPHRYPLALDFYVVDNRFLGRAGRPRFARAAVALSAPAPRLCASHISLWRVRFHRSRAAALRAAALDAQQINFHYIKDFYYRHKSINNAPKYMSENMPPEKPVVAQDDKLELSIFDMLNVAKVYLRQLLIFSWLIIAAALLLGYYLYQRKAKQPTTYTATLTFMLSEDRGFQQGMIGSLFGSTLGNSDAGNFSLAKLDELIFTRSIIQKVLFYKVPLAKDAAPAKDDYLINHYIDLFGYRQQWKDSGSPMANFYFTSDSVPTFNRDESALLLSIYSQLVNTHLNKYSTPGGVFTLNFTSASEVYSFEFINAMFYVFNEYYVEKTTEKQKKLLQVATERVGQLYSKMGAAEQAYINYLNQNGASAAGQNHVKIQQQYLARELQVETEAYFGAVRAREAAVAALAQNMPLIQVIDAPIYPLSVSQPNAFIYFVIGAFAGALIAAVLVILREIVSDFWQKEKAKHQAAQLKKAQNNPIA